MATIRKRNSSWRVDIKVKGQREPGSFPTKREAQLRSIKGGRSLTHTVKDVFDRYADEVSPTKRGERWERIRLNALCKMPLAEVKLSDLSAREVSEWRDTRLKSVGPATVNRELNLISHCFEIARREWRWIEASPTKDVTRPKAPPHRVKPRSP